MAFTAAISSVISPAGAQPTMPGDPDKAMPGVPVALAPVDGSVDVPLITLLEWSEEEFADFYTLQLADNDAFKDPLVDVNELTDNQYQTDQLDMNTTYFWRVRSYNDEMESEWSDPWSFTTETITSAEDPILPATIRLHQNYPNPFNPETVIAFDLAGPSPVTLAIYNVTGQRVTTLLRENRTSGRHEIRFNAAGLPSGTYIYRLYTNETVQYRSMTLVK